jgi:hypothetical protein
LRRPSRSFALADRFFAIHPGNSDLVTIDDSPTKATDHFLVMRAGSGFASPTIQANTGRGPATSIIVQMHGYNKVQSSGAR